MTEHPILRFHGAAGSVTGSNFLLETGSTRILVDCGMFQGSKTEKELNYRPLPYDVGSLAAVILTHAHIDHSGLIPKLVKAGYAGPILATAGTLDLCSVMLPDSGYIQQVEVEQLNKRSRRRRRDPVEPIYTVEDALASMAQFRSIAFEQWHRVSDDIRFRFWNAGHMLGSASVEVEATAPAGPIRILFSGDLGPGHKLLQFDPEAPAGFDHVVVESTYGDTDRGEITEAQRRGALRAEVRAAIHDNGALLIPSFAVERTQELLADLVQLMDAGDLPVVPIVIDSPLAGRASQIFHRHARHLENGDRLVRAMEARNVRFTETVEQSKALDHIGGFHIVIAASGMCEAGRIRHRLKNWLWRDEATVLLVGYQAAGTLGRILEDGARRVRIQGEEIEVRARIRKLDIYSGHADGPELAGWVGDRQPIRGSVFLVHGEQPALDGLRGRLSASMPESRIVVPRLDAAFELTPEGARDISAAAAPPRIDPVRTGRPDWHNDLQRLILDLEAELAGAADDRSRGVVIRRLRRAMEGRENDGDR
jgi:metallo-beta-lactamase family protein